MRKKILIADDHQVIIFAVSKMLKDYFPDAIIDHANNYETVKQKILNENFDLVILDIKMPGSIYKLMIKEIKSIQKDILIMIFTSEEDDSALEYIREGAEGFLNKSSNQEKFIRALVCLFEDGYYYPLTAFNEAMNSSYQINNIKSLSEREFQIFELLAQGNGILEISNILNISNSTVSTYKRRIYNKLELSNVVELSKTYYSFKNEY